MKALSVTTAAALGMAALLAACDGGPSAVAQRGGPAGPTIAATPVSTAPVPMINGRPMWAANRRHSAQDNASYQFRRNGADFGAASEQQYVAAAHAFVGHPPAGVQRLTRRNGDVLMYDAAGNTFAVVAASGAPRTMFKPRTGAAYWRQQQERVTRDATRQASRERGEGDQEQAAG